MVPSLSPQVSVKFVQGFYPTIVNWPRDLSVLSKQVTTEVALTCFSGHKETLRLPLGFICRSPPEPATDRAGALVGGTWGRSTSPFSRLSAQRPGHLSLCSHFLDRSYRCQCGSGTSCKVLPLTLLLPSPSPEETGLGSLVRIVGARADMQGGTKIASYSFGLPPRCPAL